MSNHPSDNTKRRLLRRALAGILTLALMLGLLPASAFTAHAASWADPYVQTLVDWGVMRGDIGGNMAPDRSITRAEFVTMMNRAYGYTKLGGHPFTDVRVRDWYSEDIDIAYNIGYFKGTSDTTASPNASLTREQAAVLLARNMMLQETVGETLGFSDTRRLSDWSRGLVGAAAANGIISGYEDGSFQPMRNITRGEVAAMLVRAIGTPIQSAGDHALGNVYGNVTVNASGVKLRDGVIVGNLYLTGGIDLGDVLLENVTVLGEIVVSGGGESNSSQSSIILRNVVADKMIVDSIGDQFVTIRAEGNTDIPTTTVRTNAYVDDSSLPGYGLSYIELDGEEGALYQLAGNIKEAVNKTPGSDLQIVQGIADKVTVDEKATGSSVLVDGDAQVGELNLDTGTDVTGTGDIKDLNVGSSGSTVEQLPDNIVIRPGINADIAGSNMNSTQGAESSADPKLLAGYPAVRKIAPQSAELVFRVNKPGTIYWAVSAVADGSVSEADLLEPPVYGNKVLASGKISATAANTDYTAAVNRLTSGGSYYVTAMLVDGRDQHSPIKVTSFSTPDSSVPAFAPGYPVMTLRTTEIAQATVMTTKSCLLYYALLPAGAKAPTEQEFKSAAIPGNLGYGSQSVTKNVTIPININNQPLEEKTNYVVYFWLVDHDGAQKSAVVALPFTTLDETPPNVTYIEQTNQGTNSVTLDYRIDEDPADLVWAIVTEGNHSAKEFLNFEWEEVKEPGSEDHFTLKFASDADELAAKVRLVNGAGALLNGTSRNSPLTISGAVLSGQNAKTSSFVVYYVAHDRATASGNLSEHIKGLYVHTLDNIPPQVELRFTNPDQTEVTENPHVEADIRIIFSESVKGGTAKDQNVFLRLYEDVLKAKEEWDTGDSANDTNSEAAGKYEAARTALGKALDQYLTMYTGTPDGPHEKVKVRETDAATDDWVVDWRNAVVERLDDGSGRVQVVLHSQDKKDQYGDTVYRQAVDLGSGVSYYFHLAGVYDLATPPNPLDPSPCDLKFTTVFAKVLLSAGDELTMNGKGVASVPGSTNDPARIDYHFIADPQGVGDIDDDNLRWDMLIWADTSMEITLYSRPEGGGNWTKVGVLDIPVDQKEGWAYRSLSKWKDGPDKPNATPSFEVLNKMEKREYAIHVNKLQSVEDASAWNRSVSIRVSIVAGGQTLLSNSVINGSTPKDYDTALSLGVSSVGTPDPFIMTKLFTDSAPPAINNKPTIDIGDVGAEISMTLDRPGQVYYLVIPLKNLSAGGQAVNENLELFESTVKTVDNYTPGMDVLKGNAVPSLGDVPLMTGDPDLAESPNIAKCTVDRPIRDDFISDRVYPTVLKGSTTSVPAHTPAVIDLQGKLEPNKVYLVCLLTRGVSAVYSREVSCYRFTTDMPKRPGLELHGTNANAVDAIVGSTCDLRSVLLIDSGVATTDLAKFLNEPFDDYVHDDLEADYAKTSYAKRYTVREALLNDHQTGAKGIQPSVFDHFASDDVKKRVETLINTTSAPMLIHSYWGTEKVSVVGSAENAKKTMTFSAGKLQPGAEYICLAYAKSGSTSSTSFRAAYPLQLQDDDPPVLSAVGLNLELQADGKAYGDIMLNFDKDLYNKMRVPLAQSPTIGQVNADPQLWGLGGLVQVIGNVTIVNDTPNLTGPISSIKLHVDGNIPQISVTVREVYSEWGTRVRKPYEVNIFPVYPADPNAPPDQVTFKYEIKELNG